MSIGKAIAGLLLGGAVVGTTVIVTTTVTKKKYAEVPKDSDFEEQSSENETDILKKIKDFAVDKVDKILGWFVDHKEQVETATLILGLVGAVAEVVYNIARMKSLGDLASKLEDIRVNGASFERGFDEAQNQCFGLLIKHAVEGTAFGWHDVRTGAPTRSFMIQEVKA